MYFPFILPSLPSLVGVKYRLSIVHSHKSSSYDIEHSCHCSFYCGNNSWLTSGAYLAFRSSCEQYRSTKNPRIESWEAVFYSAPTETAYLQGTCRTNATGIQETSRCTATSNWVPKSSLTYIHTLPYIIGSIQWPIERDVKCHNSEGMPTLATISCHENCAFVCE